jgi:hypothetical protein
MHSASPDEGTFERKMESVQRLSNKDVMRAKQGFSGNVVVHWIHGEPKEENVTVKNQI